VTFFDPNANYTAIGDQNRTLGETPVNQIFYAVGTLTMETMTMPFSLGAQWAQEFARRVLNDDRATWGPFVGYISMALLIALVAIIGGGLGFAGLTIGSAIG